MTTAETTAVTTDMISATPTTMEKTVTILETMTPTSSVQILPTDDGQSMSSSTQNM